MDVNNYGPPRGPFLTSPLAPRGELHPQAWSWPPGVKFVPKGGFSPLHSPPGVNTLYFLEEWRGELHPQGITSPPGQSFPQGAKLRMGLWCLGTEALPQEQMIRVWIPPGYNEVRNIHCSWMLRGLVVFIVSAWSRWNVRSNPARV
jgi:hypothetical protein